MSTALRAPRAASSTQLRTADLLRVTYIHAAAVLDGDVEHFVPHPWPTDCGALTVVSGAVTEHAGVGYRLRTRTQVAGDQAAFPLGWVHDVVGSGGGGEPTLSVHAYSPPLTAMSYYEVGNGATLRRTRSVLTDRPEQE